MVWIYVVAVFTIALIIGGIYFSNRAINPKTLTPEKTMEIESDTRNVDYKAFEAMDKEEVYLESPYGYKMYGLFFSNEGSNKTIILVHGITYTLFGSVKYMNMFYKRGYNVLMYDHRNHGRSEGKYTSFGYYEKYDLKAWTDWVYHRIGSDSIVGLHGESMGAATVLQNVAIDDRIKFVIADCGYSDLKELFTFRIKEDFNMPAFPILHIASLITKIRIGFMIRNVSPIKDIEKVETPIFFIHGEHDRYVPTNMCRDMYDIKKGYKKVYIANDAKHADSYAMHSEEYEIKVNEFLDEIGY